MSLRSRASLLFAFLSTLGLVLAAASARADPTVELDWNSIMCRDTPLDLSLGPEAILGTSVLGQVDLQRAYALHFAIRRIQGTGVPDAWRFDPKGCASGQLFFVYLNPIPEACPHLSGPAFAVPAQSATFDLSAGIERLDFQLDYPPGASAPDPQRRYVLLWLDLYFDEAVAGPGNPPTTCGGLDEPVCIQLESATWTGVDGAVHPWTIATPFASVNAAALGGPAACAATPAHAATWGAIKQQYR